MQRRELFQYTNLESFLKVITGQYLKFNRIDNVNDKKEKQYFGDLEVSKLAFISCFSYEKIESIPLWHIYTKAGYGVRLGFHIDDGSMINVLKDSTRPVKAIGSNGDVENLNFQNDTLHSDVSNHAWYVELNQRDIVYNENEITNNPIKQGTAADVGELYNLTAMGAIKNESWSYETESRMIAFLKTTRDNIEIPDYEYLLVPINLRNASKISIIFSPWMADEVKDCIRLAVEKHLSGCNVYFNDSIYQNIVERK